MQYTEYLFTPKALPQGLELETVYDLLCELLGEVGFDSFEQGDALKAYIPTSQIDHQAIADALSSFPIERISFAYTYEDVPEVNWNEEWEKHYFQPIILGDKLCAIRAPFHQAIEGVRTEVIISPKMAFGTGNHATTALVIEYLIEQGSDLNGKRVLDMGCGTGILGILALKLGAQELTAIDIDQWAYLNVLENAQLNGVAIPDALQGDASSLQGRGVYDLILANITRNILLEDLGSYASALKSGANIVLSGFYTEDIPLLQELGETLGLSYVSHKSQDNWARLVLRKN